MRILLVSNSYAPEETGIAPYTTGLAEHLVTQGYDVTVITGLPSYPQWRIYPEYRGVLRTRELGCGVDIRRIRSYVPRTQSALRRGMYEASILLGGLTALPCRRPNVVVATVPALSCGVIARIAARRFSVNYALVFQDLTGPAATQTGVSGASRAVGPIAAVEGWAARGATTLGIIAEGFRPYLESLAVDPTRIRRVRNWIHIDEPKLDRMAARQCLGLPEDAIICLHAGNMGYKQGLANVVECARLAAEADHRLLFVLVGDGSQRPLLMELVQRYKLQNIRFLPVQPARLFSSVLAAADVLLVNQRGSVTNMALPSKLTSYLASGRPVVAAISPNSETAAELRNTGAGVLVTPDRADRLLQAIRDIVIDPARQNRLSDAGRRYARTTLTADQALAGLEDLITSAATPTPSNGKLLG